MNSTNCEKSSSNSNTNNWTSSSNSNIHNNSNSDSNRKCSSCRVSNSSNGTATRSVGILSTSVRRRGSRSACAHVARAKHFTSPFIFALSQTFRHLLVSGSFRVSFMCVCMCVCVRVFSVFFCQASPVPGRPHLRPWKDEGQGGIPAVGAEPSFPFHRQHSGEAKSLTISNSSSAKSTAYV